ncbi:hypothetical protein Tco_0286669 [Tanacetum coccineum]
MVLEQVKTMKIQYEVKFQDQENTEDIFSFECALEDFICVVFVLDRNIHDTYFLKNGMPRTMPFASSSSMMVKLEIIEKFPTKKVDKNGRPRIKGTSSSSASVEAQISLIMLEFSSCLLAYSAINLVSDSSKLVDRVHQTVCSKPLREFSLLPLVDNPSYSVVKGFPGKCITLKKRFSTTDVGESHISARYIGKEANITSTTTP